jgi:folate-dependent phosphoribosylglycinamide formyltransferase PurN|tara:strand:+ start:1107 stop:1661 length:555 start_codon:yes stop_codon:yes gene_type:complete
MIIDMKDQKWIALFSQSGSEIALIAEALGRWPDEIITNRTPGDIHTLNPAIATESITYLSNTPTAEEYLEALGEEPALITLHGWLRIIPEAVIQQHPDIINGHPGALSIQEGVLKGMNPQEKAYRMNLTVSGCVLHKVTAGVDEGPVLEERLVEIKDLSLDGVYEALHETSVSLWVSFLKGEVV